VPDEEAEQQGSSRKRCRTHEADTTEGNNKNLYIRFLMRKNGLTRMRRTTERANEGRRVSNNLYLKFIHTLNVILLTDLEIHRRAE